MDAQIEDLQVRIAHQELAIEALNETVARQDQAIARLQQQLVEVTEMLRELKPSPLGSEPTEEPPPPHY